MAPEYGQQMVIHYAEALQKRGKYALTIWPYHAMLGGIGHALVSSVAEALFFHSVARFAQTEILTKGERNLHLAPRRHIDYSQTIDIDSEGGSLPNNAAYVTLDGDLRRNVWVRAETRAARAPYVDTGLQWYFAVDTRTRPSRTTTFDVLWNR